MSGNPPTSPNWQCTWSTIWPKRPEQIESAFSLGGKLLAVSGVSKVSLKTSLAKIALPTGTDRWKKPLTDRVDRKSSQVRRRPAQKRRHHGCKNSNPISSMSPPRRDAIAAAARFARVLPNRESGTGMDRAAQSDRTITRFIARVVNRAVQVNTIPGIPFAGSGIQPSSDPPHPIGDVDYFAGCFSIGRLSTFCCSCRVLLKSMPKASSSRLSNAMSFRPAMAKSDSCL